MNIELKNISVREQFADFIDNRKRVSEATVLFT